LGICDDRGDEILPVLWEDNYFSLLPGESRVVVARYPAQELSAHSKLEVEGWNVGRVNVPVAQIDTGIRKYAPVRSSNTRINESAHASVRCAHKSCGGSRSVVYFSPCK